MPCSGCRALSKEVKRERSSGNREIRELRDAMAPLTAAARAVVQCVAQVEVTVGHDVAHERAVQNLAHAHSTLAAVLIAKDKVGKNFFLDS